jgi:valyl-tRNA synthetase
MDKTYDPTTIEQHWYEQWEAQGHFSPAPAGDTFCIMIPPPNVTGSLHMGHAFQDTIMDALIRFHRMTGKSTLWQAGTDHAGIATQMVVERQLNAAGQSRQDIGREKFVDKVWEWKETSGGTITNQLRRMGASLDWEHERFTMDEGLSEAVLETFVQLHEDGLIYRGKRLVNWDPVLHTAISDLEVVSSEEDGHLWHIRYPLTDGSGHVVVATTRPETMLGDSGVAVNPKDERYQHLIGETVELPLVGRRIPIVGDDYVDPDFGTGCLKITPAHDFNDYDVGRRHDLAVINIFTPDASLNEEAPAAYQGMDRYVARKKVVEDLSAAGLIDKIVDHRFMVPRGDRSQSVVEPYLTDQWFVRIGPLAEPAIEAVKNGDIKFVPANWAKTYFDWMNDIQDWCISRQLWWGHRIPAWYDDEGNIYVARSEKEVRVKHGLGADIKLSQDPDVLDTWFSSALWPFSTLGWPADTSRLRTYYPTNVLVTGFDIIFFWVARMIMMGLRFMGEVPFSEIYIHGLVRAEDGDKMSKSKGNIIDPLDLIDGIDLEALVKKRTTGLMRPDLAPKIEETTRRQFPNGIPAYGTDALRFTFCSLATTGRDIRFDLARVQGYRNFCNKLWNAARFVLMNTQDKSSDGSTELGLAERWIVSLQQTVIQQVRDAIAQYRFDHAAQAIYEFVWNEYCDWYLELAKTNLTADEDSPAARGTRVTLVYVLESLLRLSHPLIPFISEAIWQRVAHLAGKDGPTIMLEPYPEPELARMDRSVFDEMAWLKGFVLGIRQIRGEMNISPSKSVPILLQHGDNDDRTRMDANREHLVALAKIESIEWLEDDVTPPQSAMALLGELKLYIPMAGLIDKDAEKERLGKELEKINKDLAKSNAKLSNANFVYKAPTAVVDKEKGRVEEMRAAVQGLMEQLGRLD